MKILIAPEPLPESQLILAAVPAELADAHRERLEEAISAAREAVARLERAMAAAARTPQVVPA